MKQLEGRQSLRTGVPAGRPTGHPAARGAALVWATLVGVGLAAGQEAEGPRPGAGSSKGVLVQGSTEGTAPEAGAPPRPEASLEPRLARLRIEPPGETAGRDTSGGPALRALTVSDDEATLEIDGRREVVRPGSRLGDAVVKSIGPGRLVLVRPAVEGDPRGEALVLLTFEDDGRARRRVFWTRDPSVPEAPEVKTP